jgi:hypothetical protein
MRTAHSWQPIRVNNRCQVWARVDGVWAETLIRGRVDLEAAKGVTALFDRIIAEHGHCAGFHDWWDVASYEASCRLWFEGWLASLPAGAIRATTVLTRSRIMRMGITLSNLKYRHITFRAFPDRASYERLRDHEMKAPRPPDPT